MYDNKLIRAVCIIIALATAITSAMLTFDFMRNLGSEGSISNVMGGIGLIMDATKVIAPFLVFFFWAHKHYLRSAFAAILTFALSAVSFTASISAIENRIDDVREISHQALAANNQTAFLMKQVEDYQTLAREQRSVGQLTASKATLSRVDEILSKIEIVNQAANKSVVDKTVVKYGKEITIACALLIECVSILMAMALHNSFNLGAVKDEKGLVRKEQLEDLLSTYMVRTDHSAAQLTSNVGVEEHEYIPQTSDVALQQTLRADRSADVESSVEATLSTPIHSKETNEPIQLKADSMPVMDVREEQSAIASLDVSNSLNEQCVDTLKVVNEPTLEEKIRAAVIEKKMNPSIRGLKSLGGKREQVNQVLSNMLQEGILEEYRRGYRLKTTQLADPQYA